MPSLPFPGTAVIDPPEATRPLDQLLAELRSMADSERMKGNYLEQLVRHYLTLEPLWADQLGQVWLWRDWPGRAGRPDTGVDLVAETDGGLLAVQVKFYAEDRRIQKPDLDSFFEALGRDPFTEGLVVDTTAGEWSATAVEALKNRTKPVRRVSLEELRHSSIDWSTYTLAAPAEPPQRHERKTPRAHQHQAISTVIERFTGADGEAAVDRGKLVMACGTGKTFTSLKLAERWTREQCHGTSAILFMVPSLALLQQTLSEWSAERDPDLPFRAFAVGSDTNIGRTKNDDLTSVMLEDLGAPATTDGARLAALLEDTETDEGMTVVFSTYQSIDAVAQAQRLGAPAFDLVICDEAHRTTGVTLADEDESHFVKVHDDEVIYADKRLYMTATPRIFAPEVKNAARQQDAELVSMDDEALYGPLLYRIGFDEAVRRGLLTDYKVVVLGVSEDQVATQMQAELAEHRELRLSDVTKLVGCWNALAKRNQGAIAEGFGGDTEPMRRAVAFARDIKTSQGVAADFQELVETHLSRIDNDDRTDDLTVQAKHVDGTMNATERGALLDWLKSAQVTDEIGRPVARVLANARCLSEGVDVPSLDAVLFLSPRKSQVDVVQAVGRVMRRAEGKKLGYIVLPIAVPANVSPEEALADNERYKVVWQVLQALRAHDERLDAAINQATFTGKLPEQVQIEQLDLATKPGRPSAFDREADGRPATDHPANTDGAGAAGYVASTLPGLGGMEWKDAVHARLVAKVGDRLYWDDWADDITQIAKRFITLISAHIGRGAGHRVDFESFVDALRATVNPEVGEDQAVEMLAQHIITGPIFEAMFPGGSFTQDNPVSLALGRVLSGFEANEAFAREREPLDAFYARVTERIRGLDSVRAKQQMLLTLYDKFFSRAFPKLADQMGIVFTPVEVVDYILHSADEVLRLHFGKSLSDEGVNIIDPFVGTGTFLTRLMQSGLIRPEDLHRKYTAELFANEIVLLSYYIAAVNIEAVYRELCAEHGLEPAEGGFSGISLSDTFAMDERDGQLAGGVFPVNTARLEQQRATAIDVVVMNPPYRANQASSNDDAQNAKYPLIDTAIERSYVARSTGNKKGALYDSYYRALRWATDRIAEGVIAFVSNSGFIDAGTANGVRLTWAEEFSDIIVYNLRGNQRVKDWQAEGGKVFGEGSRTGVAITVLVKNPGHTGPARIHYRDIGDHLTREEKLERLRTEISVTGSETEGGFQVLEPNSAGDWINQRDERFGTFQPLGDKETKGRADTPAVFCSFSLGLATARDAWAFNFSLPALRGNIRRHVDHLNAERERVHALRRSGETQPVEKLIRRDGTQGSWAPLNIRDLKKNEPTVLHEDGLRPAVYRPFTRQHVYFDRTARLNERPYLTPRIWPTAAHENLVINVPAGPSAAAFMPIMYDILPSLTPNGGNQIFPRYIWEPAEPDDGGFDLATLGEEAEVVDGYRRVDNITDATLAAYREVHGAGVTNDDVFYGIYALLHHPEYRETYAADLQKMLPRIPQVTGFPEYARIGRELAALHLDYEKAPAYAGVQEEWSLHAPEEPFERYRIDKLNWGARKDRSRIRYNAHLTLTGIPEEEAGYRVGGRSPLEWVLDRYRVTTHKASGIVNDPNDWLREQDDPAYVVDLIKSLVTLSLETQRLIAALPRFEVLDQVATEKAAQR